MFSGRVNVYPCCGSSVQRQGSDAKEFLANPLTHLRWLTVESRRKLCDGYTVAGSEPNIGEGCTMSGKVRFNPWTNDRTTSVSEELRSRKGTAIVLFYSYCGTIIKSMV